MDVFTTYTYSTAGWFSLQALPLLLSPKLIVTLLSVESRNPTGELPSPPNPSVLWSDRGKRLCAYCD